MANLYLYANKDAVERLQKAVEELNSLELSVVMRTSDEDEHGYRDVEIETTSTYELYRLGIKVGKLLTNKE